ncbi:hypothetical protein FOZ63_010056, partial [Perkinsus olseni]
MTGLYDHAELRRVTSSILHYLDSKLRYLLRLRRSVYGTAWDSLIEIDVENDIGRYRTIGSGDVQDAEATILNRRSPYSGGKAGIFMMHTSGPVVAVVPAPESDAPSSLTIP